MCNVRYALENFKSNLKDIQELIKELMELNPLCDKITYTALQNQLLIKIYTGYEQYVKRVIKILPEKNKNDYFFQTIFAEHEYNIKGKDKGWAPLLTIEKMRNRFTILDEWYYFKAHMNEFETKIHGIINLRNSYAHEGGDKEVKLKDLLNAIYPIFLMVTFIFYFYELPSKEEICDRKRILEDENHFMNNINKMMRILENQNPQVNELPSEVIKKIKINEIQEKSANYAEKMKDSAKCTVLLKILQKASELNINNINRLDDNIDWFKSIKKAYDEYILEEDFNQIEITNKKCVNKMFKKMNEGIEALCSL
ncbi:hypothetical protein [Ligilactobacillus aviarius]|uniref:hypothetical protein n=1 Tax=Ligilactobacillus aviarius TaxID=1606 RepID=UPI0019576E22|nr:hypothetical protein [Ligilactobacillus aviarius]MBM6862511.1 hypothetical protein [Ligilactobacillus aviarius]